MKNVKVRRKLEISFLVVCVFSVLTGMMGIIGMNKINQANDIMYYKHLQSVDIIGEMRENLQAQRVVIRNFVVYAGNENKINEIRNGINKLDKEMIELFARYEETVVDSVSEQVYNSAKRLYQIDFTEIIETTAAAGREGYASALEVLEGSEASTIVNEILELFTTALGSNRSMAEAAVAANTELYNRMIVIAILIIAAAVAVSLIISAYLSGIISKPMDRMSAALKQFGTTGNLVMDEENARYAVEDGKRLDEIGVCAKSALDLIKHLSDVEELLRRVADGDLTVEVPVLSDKDNIGKSVEEVVGNLSKMMEEIREAAIQVSRGTKQISEGSQSLAQGSTEQAAAVEELSATIAELAVNTKSNAEMAVHASGLAGAIKGNAEKGNRQMNEMLLAVKEIQEAGKSIGNVIKVIDDIAFQTNILALNAAVEAARAGQYGKGFAVVAEEVRNLAAKSAEAAKDTGSLIANSIQKSEYGAQIAQETAVSLSDIVAGINESSRIIEQIAESSEAQASAITQINSGIEQVAQVVQNNSATSEEAASASIEMSRQAEAVEELVTQFKIRGTERRRKNREGDTEGAKMKLPERVGIGKY